jgi:hypothetical protein
MGEVMNIIELANESGLVYYGMGKDRARFIHHLENFAHLVAAATRADEREECAKLMFILDLGGHEEKAANEIRARGTT